ncbi:cupin domain-containing protein [Paenibacillus piri]|uniref:Cupin domain-containing protein n=1 Tax=Paenibacillus piri TaxID=2547395 RepID=A0A4R5KCY4_9BACL|nr:cupin domain-containing protein [Paenibacillus piri]TDF92722.1 cupin domain-containing protein [Paenibacillus piri]
MVNKSKPVSEDNKVEIDTMLVHPDGSSVTFLENGLDGQEEFITIEHRITRKGAINGPHWHPELKETFKIKEGRMRFLVDGQEIILETGEEITIQPRQVHQFWNIG